MPLEIPSGSKAEDMPRDVAVYESVEKNLQRLLRLCIRRSRPTGAVFCVPASSHTACRSQTRLANSTGSARCCIAALCCPADINDILKRYGITPPLSQCSEHGPKQPADLSSTQPEIFRRAAVHEAEWRKKNTPEVGTRRVPSRRHTVAADESKSSDNLVSSHSLTLPGCSDSRQSPLNQRQELGPRVRCVGAECSRVQSTLFESF